MPFAYVPLIMPSKLLTPLQLHRGFHYANILHNPRCLSSTTSDPKTLRGICRIKRQKRPRFSKCGNQYSSLSPPQNRHLRFQLVSCEYKICPNPKQVCTHKQSRRLTRLLQVRCLKRIFCRCVWRPTALKIIEAGTEVATIDAREAGVPCCLGCRDPGS